MNCWPLRVGYPFACALLLAAVLVAGSLLPAAHQARAATTFTVTMTGDEPDLDLTDPDCDVSAEPGAQCTLRAAIQEANATPGADTIAFDIPGGGVQTIRPASALPTTARKVTIDGYTQPGASPNTAAVGTNAQLRIELDGSAAAGGFVVALTIEGANSLVRGLVINRFDFGISIEANATGTQIAGCFLGTNDAGTAALGNVVGAVGVTAAGVTVGGSGRAARNIISGNLIDGILLNPEVPDTRVLGNLIGTDRTGMGDLGNGDDGIDSNGVSAIIGGSTAAEANVIAFNDGDGVEVFDPATANRILRNSIFANGDLGIDLDGGGRDFNDPRDTDDGANTLQNFPVITQATSTRVRGRLSSTPNQDFVLRLFSNPPGGDEGKVFEAGPVTVTTDASGSASFVFTLETSIPAGRSVTTTATNRGGSTSEFSPPRTVTAS